MNFSTKHNIHKEKRDPKTEFWGLSFLNRNSRYPR